MRYPTKIAYSKEEKEAIYRFRFKVYMEELHITHIAADHDKKMLFDEADKYTVLYYVMDDREVIGTVRSQRGTEGMFLENDINFFGLGKLEGSVGYHKIAIVDRLIVAKAYRRSPLAHELMLATYLGGLEAGTKICFITCDEILLPMYLRYGFREYAAPALLPSGEKRCRLVLLLCDKEHLHKVRSPFLGHLPHHMDDMGFYAKKVEEQMGFKLTMELQAPPIYERGKI